MRMKFPAKLSVVQKKPEKPWPFEGENIFRRGKYRNWWTGMLAHRDMRCGRPVPDDIVEAWRCDEYMQYRTHGSRLRLTLCSVCPIHKLPPLGKRMTIYKAGSGSLL